MVAIVLREAPQHRLDAVARARALRHDRHAVEHAHAALVEQPIDQPLARHRRIEQFEVLDGLDQRAALDPGVVLLDGVRDRALRRVARREIGDARPLRRLRQELQQHAAGAPAVAGAGRHLLADREPHPGGDLLGAPEVFVRGILQAAAVERDQPLVAARVGALIDGHGEVALAEQRAGRGLAGLDGAGHPALVEARAGAHLAGAAEIHHQHADRAVGLGLQDEAALDLERRAEQHRQRHGLAEQLGHRRGIVVAARESRPPRGRAAPRGRADRVPRPRTAGRYRRRMVFAGARTGMSV